MRLMTLLGRSGVFASIFSPLPFARPWRTNQLSGIYGSLVLNVPNGKYARGSAPMQNTSHAVIARRFEPLHSPDDSFSMGSDR
jgi:hypothetical protein